MKCNFIFSALPGGSPCKTVSLKLFYSLENRKVVPTVCIIVLCVFILQVPSCGSLLAFPTVGPSAVQCVCVRTRACIVNYTEFTLEFTSEKSSGPQVICRSGL